ncbi:hypothetical protein HYR65_03160 [Candidatus Azambacteria bacterium]|nr:hypothetical protein [Candidatus Azambacteria bacterium]
MQYAIADLPVQIIKQGRLYIAYSHKLDISTTGKSEKQAVDNFGDLVHVFIKDMLKNGAPKQALVDLGWTQRAKRWQPPVTKAAIAVVKTVPAV